ncbi:hypothetical protein UCDDA912_g03478 [Diaporthe ampelina]|uniref:Uncharacterized protein n=1 Tax=Diaporthe ampelina TaxID=1214573 RepID=A0A0G2HNQ6_9PEZI|nr:hypothetical protein UCDDA912_g03478 [Diaporthe ampelina]
MASSKEAPRKEVSNTGSSGVSPKPHVALGTLPPQAAHAPEFVPGEAFQSPILNKRIDNQKGEKKTSEAGSDQEKTLKKKKKTKEPTEAEEAAQDKARREQAMDEEWWSGDEDFAPN